MLTRVGAMDLASVPDMAETRRRLWEDELEFYNGFLRDEDHAPVAQREVGRAHGRIALDRAEEFWNRAIELQRALVANGPSQPADFG